MAAVAQGNAGVLFHLPAAWSSTLEPIGPSIWLDTIFVDSNLNGEASQCFLLKHVKSLCFNEWIPSCFQRIMAICIRKKAVQQTTTHWDPQIQSNPLTRSASTANISLRSSGKSSANAITLRITITGHGRRIDSSDWLETSWNHLRIWADWFETSWNHLRIWAHKSRNHPCSVSHGTVSVSHGTPWYPILLSFKMQLPNGRLLPRKAQHLRVCRSWRRLSHEGPHQENHQVGPNCLSLSLGRGSTSTYFNTEHSSWFDCFLAKCRMRQCPWTAICKRSMGWPLEHPNYATLHNEQLVWGITTSKSSRQLNLSGEIVEFQASWAEITLAAVLWCDQNRF